MRPAELRVARITNDGKLELSFTGPMTWPENILDLLQNEVAMEDERLLGSGDEQSSPSGEKLLDV